MVCNNIIHLACDFLRLRWSHLLLWSQLRMFTWLLSAVCQMGSFWCCLALPHLSGMSVACTTGVTQLCSTHRPSSRRLASVCSHGKDRGANACLSHTYFQTSACITLISHCLSKSLGGAQRQNGMALHSYMAKTHRCREWWSSEATDKIKLQQIC